MLNFCAIYPSRRLGSLLLQGMPFRVGVESVLKRPLFTHVYFDYSRTRLSLFELPTRPQLFYQTTKLPSATRQKPLTTLSYVRIEGPIPPSAPCPQPVLTRALARFPWGTKQFPPWHAGVSIRGPQMISNFGLHHRRYERSQSVFDSRLTFRASDLIFCVSIEFPDPRFNSSSRISDCPAPVSGCMG